MPADHGAGRTGESPVSAEACQSNRTDWNMPPRPTSLGRCCSDAFDADGFHGSHPGSAGALARPTRAIARNIRSRLSGEAQAWEVSPGCNQGIPAGEGAGAPRDANGPRTTIYPCSDARTPAVRNRPRASGTCPGLMELPPGRDKEGNIASPVVFTLPRHGPGECRSAHPRSLPRHRSR